MKMKKLLALALVAVMSVSMVACSKDGGKKDDPAASEEAVGKVVEELVSEYIDAGSKKIKDSEDILENMEDLLDPDGKAYEECEKAVEALDKMIKDHASRYGISEDVAEDLFIAFTNAGRSKTKKEIEEIEMDEDKAKVTLTVKIADGEEAYKKLGEFITKEGQAYVESKYNMTYAQFKQQLAQLPVDQQNKILIESNAAAFESVTKKMEDVMDDVTVDEQSQTITVEKIDDEWLITDVK